MGARRAPAAQAAETGGRAWAAALRGSCRAERDCMDAALRRPIDKNKLPMRGSDPGFLLLLPQFVPQAGRPEPEVQQPLP